jgi:hypothetical protein
MFVLALKKGILSTMRVSDTGRDDARWPDVAPSARVVWALSESARTP